MADQQPAPERRFAALSEQECLEHLRSVHFGHLATTSRAMPVVVPVRLEVVGAEVLLEPVLEELGKIAGDVVVALGAGNIGTGNIGTGNIGTGNIGAGNIGTGNIGTGNIGEGNIGTGNIGEGNIGEGASAEWTVHAIGVLLSIAGSSRGQQGIATATTGAASWPFALRPCTLSGWRREAAHSRLHAC